MIYFTQVSMVGGAQHEHIARLRWQDPANGQTGENSRAELVAWLHQSGASAKVSNGGRTVDVGIVKANPEYLRTYADGIWTDNLLALPRF